MSLGIQNCHSLGVEFFVVVFFLVVVVVFFCVLGFFEMYIQRAYLLFTDGDRKVNCPSEKLKVLE